MHFGAMLEAEFCSGLGGVGWDWTLILETSARGEVPGGQKLFLECVVKVVLYSTTTF